MIQVLLETTPKLAEHRRGNELEVSNIYELTGALS